MELSPFQYFHMIKLRSVIFMQLIENGRLLIPLHHRTSTLFLDDILAMGLGADSPVKKYRIMETLEKLVHKGYEYSEQLPRYENALLKEGTMIINQTGANYRYGGVFLTPSLFMAVRYSASNNYGSELIYKTLRLFHLLKENSVPVELDNDFLSQIIDQTYQPVILVTTDIPLSWLQAESSKESVEGNIKWMKEIIEKFGPNKLDEMTQQTNFELLQDKVISPENLTVISGEEYRKLKDKYIKF